VAPTSVDNGIATWTQQRGTSGNITPLLVGGFWLDVADPAIAAAAQRDLFFAGVLAGIAGGLLAGWLAAGVTFLVKRATAPGTRDAGERPPPGRDGSHLIAKIGTLYSDRRGKYSEVG
jgi:hypothetical protein